MNFLAPLSTGNPAGAETTRRMASEIDAMPGRAKTEPETMTSEIGERLAKLRKERGFTQVELAEKLGVSQAVVSEYERGESRLTAPMLLRVAEILSVSADEILGLSHAPKRRQANRRLLRRLEQIENLPQRKQDALVQTIDAFLKSAEA